MNNKEKIIKMLLNNYSVTTGTYGVLNKKALKNNYVRDNLSLKGHGFLGNINGSNDINSPVITEYTTGIQAPKDYQFINGLNQPLAPLTLKGHEYIDIPSVTPNQTPQTINEIQNGNVSDIAYELARQNALNRQFQGKPVFKQNNEVVDNYIGQ